MEIVRDTKELEKNKLDNLDKQYKAKKFFKLLYNSDISEGEKIRVLQQNAEYTKTYFFKNIDDIVKFTTNKYVKCNNTYFQLATIKEEADNGKEESLAYRYFLAFDFDKKEQEAGFNSKDVLNRFKALKLHYHALVDSGHGYHVYICLNKTNDFSMVQEVQEAIAKRVGADLNAIKSTQILRIPYTFNIKYSPLQMVNIIKAEDRSKITRYDINFLYEKNCIKSIKEQSLEQDTNIKFTLNNTNVPQCIEEILQKGSTEGERYSDLQKIVVTLRQRNKSLSEIKAICNEWSIKSNYEDNLDYRIENIYNNLSYTSMNCKECSHKKECYNVVVSDFDYSKLLDLEGNKCEVLNYKERALRKIIRKGDNMLTGNEILLMNVLKNNYEGLFYSEIEKKITFKKKCRLSKPTLLKALNDLQEKKLIQITKGYKRGKEQNFYKINSERLKPEETIQISYFATIMCICRLITPSELRLYYIMRYLHREQQKQENGLKGNLFQINQEELAKLYYGRITREGQGNISKMIDNLKECHILDVWERKPSKNNGYEYNIYRLNS